MLGVVALCCVCSKERLLCCLWGWGWDLLMISSVVLGLGLAVFRGVYRGFKQSRIVGSREDRFIMEEIFQCAAVRNGVKKFLFNSLSCSMVA